MNNLGNTRGLIEIGEEPIEAAKRELYVEIRQLERQNNMECLITCAIQMSK